MSKSLMTLTLLLPLIFVIHNIEEYVLFDKFKEIYFKGIIKKIVDKTAFLFAIIFLSVFVSSIIIINFFVLNKYLQFITIISVFAIFINGLQHCVGSLIFKKILPGSLTSFFLIIPFSIVFIFIMHDEAAMGFQRLVLYMILSLFISYLALLISLFFGYWMSKFIK